MRRFKLWIDSGANVASCRTEIVTLEEIGYTSEEWDSLDEHAKEQEMREIIFDHADWGFTEIDEDEEAE